MGLLTIAHSIALYLVARILQGASAALVNVAAFSLVTDTVTKADLGYMFGYIEVGLTLGFASGPLVGGIVYHAAGYYAVCGIAFALIAIDLVLRFALIEKKTAAFWLALDAETSPDDRISPEPASQYGALRSISEGDDESKETKFFIFGKLLQQPRILIATWTFILQAIYNTALDAVRISARISPMLCLLTWSGRSYFCH